MDRIELTADLCAVQHGYGCGVGKLTVAGAELIPRPLMMEVKCAPPTEPGGHRGLAVSSASRLFQLTLSS